VRAVGDVVFLGAYGRLSFPATIAAFVEALLQAWAKVRAGLLVPLLRAAVLLCTAMSVIVLAEKVFLRTVSSVMKLRRRRPWRVYRCNPIERPDKDEEAAAYPMVLVQIPMYNEEEVCTVLYVAGASVFFRRGTLLRVLSVNSDGCSVRHSDCQSKLIAELLILKRLNSSI